MNKKALIGFFSTMITLLIITGILAAFIILGGITRTLDTDAGEITILSTRGVGLGELEDYKGYQEVLTKQKEYYKQQTGGKT